MDKIFTIINPTGSDFNFKYIISIIIIQLSTLTIIIMQRIQYLGDLIMMLDHIKNELIRFFATFGLMIGLFLLVGKLLNEQLKYESASFFQVFLDLFNAFNGNQDFNSFIAPTGQIYIGLFMYVFEVLLMSLLAAMFINKYK